MTSRIRAGTVARILLILAPAIAFACSRSAPSAATDESATANTVPSDSAQLQGQGFVKLRAESSAPPAPELASVTQADQSMPQATPMLIRTGHAAVRVDSLEPAMARVQALAESLGGRVANTSVQTGLGELRAATLDLRIPAARFDEAVAGVEPLGAVESVNVQSQDVGEEFVDVTARVNNARRLEERLVGILATRTGKLDDVLAVERELARVRGEIERYEGRLRYLSSRVEMSAFSVYLHEPVPVIGPSAGAGPIGEAMRQAWRNFVALVAGGIASLGFILPVAVVVGVGVMLWRRRRADARPDAP
ncbi:MAG TPA: DUF4349 domain-containing protein [Gemmatimonadaceae bacterium]|nr:DUF4349 domain-containing protein [Gemmatimonadaceae bacterium]